MYLFRREIAIMDFDKEIHGYLKSFRVMKQDEHNKKFKGEKSK